MKKLLNTLFITRQGVYLAKEGETIQVKEADETLLRVPVHTLQGVVCFGRVNASASLMGFCGERGVLMSFFTEWGEFLCRVQGPVSGNVLLRRRQYRVADDVEGCQAVVRTIVCAKVANCRQVLMRAIREEYDDSESLSRQVVVLKSVLERAARPGQSVDVLRGLEGEAGKAYFGCFQSLIGEGREEFAFQGRSRRPPLDRVNAMLSFVYTLLVHDVTSALEGVGLDPACGFLHKDRPGRPSLALDLMEELRPVIADRLVLSLINRQQVRTRHFRESEGGAVLLNEEGRKEVLTAWQKRKQEEFLHPMLEERVAVGLLPHVQAMFLARYLRGDSEMYPALLWKG
ncbi:type I-C CRISPR-associated endonuclease Cas1c [Bryobacter aggregatus]|uniref:type I-C CRISPR-associated endonuclease Cas1c n=1 Tax=Bryobacter aggregatus TaxID=360054 RepID=UPI0004E23896|nr:type I-C CRISPR-associated endonuclease Cas1c [Bryobacter aggregatus]